MPLYDKNAQRCHRLALEANEHLSGAFDAAVLIALPPGATGRRPSSGLREAKTFRSRVLKQLKAARRAIFSLEQAMADAKRADREDA